jgi:hypothetical protein
MEFLEDLIARNPVLKLCLSDLRQSNYSSLTTTVPSHLPNHRQLPKRNEKNTTSSSSSSSSRHSLAKQRKTLIVGQLVAADGDSPQHRDSSKNQIVTSKPSRKPTSSTKSSHRILSVIYENTSESDKNETTAVNLHLAEMKEQEQQQKQEQQQQQQQQQTSSVELRFLKSVFAGDRRAVERLLQSNPTLSTSARVTAAKSVGTIPIGWMAIHIASYCNRASVLELLLSQPGSSPDVLTTTGQTPLHVAALKDGNIECVRLLSLSGAKVNARNTKRFGQTPLHLAALKVCFSN